MEKKEFSNIIRHLILDLVSGNIDENDERLGRLSKDEIDKAINSYPGKITMPPDKEFEEFECYEIKNSTKPEWAIDFDLWYDNERSELTLSSTIEKKENGNWVISIDDIHVL
jgi:hypothetical protein